MPKRSNKAMVRFRGITIPPAIDLNEDDPIARSLFSYPQWYSVVHDVLGIDIPGRNQLNSIPLCMNQIRSHMNQHRISDSQLADMVRARAVHVEGVRRAQLDAIRSPSPAPSPSPIRNERNQSVPPTPTKISQLLSNPRKRKRCDSTPPDCNLQVNVYKGQRTPVPMPELQQNGVGGMQRNRTPPPMMIVANGSSNNLDTAMLDSAMVDDENSSDFDEYADDDVYVQLDDLKKTLVELKGMVQSNAVGLGKVQEIGNIAGTAHNEAVALRSHIKTIRDEQQRHTTVLNKVSNQLTTFGRSMKFRSPLAANTNLSTAAYGLSPSLSSVYAPDVHGDVELKTSSPTPPPPSKLQQQSASKSIYYRDRGGHRPEVNLRTPLPQIPSPEHPDKPNPKLRSGSIADPESMQDRLQLNGSNVVGHEEDGGPRGADFDDIYDDADYGAMLKRARSATPPSRRAAYDLDDDRKQRAMHLLCMTIEGVNERECVGEFKVLFRAAELDDGIMAMRMDGSNRPHCTLIRGAKWLEYRIVLTTPCLVDMVMLKLQQTMAGKDVAGRWSVRRWLNTDDFAANRMEKEREAVAARAAKCLRIGLYGGGGGVVAEEPPKQKKKRDKKKRWKRKGQRNGHGQNWENGHNKGGGRGRGGGHGGGKGGGHGGGDGAGQSAQS